MAKDYSASLNLPNTTFAMRAELPKREPDMLKYWEELDLYDSMLKNAADKPLFVLHDGPPFSNGNIHMPMRLGACGPISVYANLYPRKMAEICRLCAAGDFRLAYQRQKSCLAQIQALFWEVNPIPVKFLASQMGLCRAEYRLPLCAPSSEVARRLCEIFRT